MLCAEEVPESRRGRREKKLRHNKVLFVTPEVWILIGHLYVYCVKALGGAVGRTISNIVSKQRHLLIRQVCVGRRTQMDDEGGDKASPAGHCGERPMLHPWAWK